MDLCFCWPFLRITEKNKCTHKHQSFRSGRSYLRATLPFSWFFMLVRVLCLHTHFPDKYGLFPSGADKTRIADVPMGVLLQQKVMRAACITLHWRRWRTMAYDEPAPPVRRERVCKCMVDGTTGEQHSAFTCTAMPNAILPASISAYYVCTMFKCCLCVCVHEQHEPHFWFCCCWLFFCVWHCCMYMWPEWSRGVRRWCSAVAGFRFIVQRTRA